MRLMRLMGAVAAAAMFVGCGNEPCTPAPPAASGPPADVAPYMPVATVLELMESTIAHAAEEYWGAVTVIVDENGVQEQYPETAEEWEEVWAAAVTIAESGNLLMMPPRAVDDGAWLEYSRALVEVGVKAAEAAQMQDPDQIFAVGEEVYNVCVACHMLYIPMEE